MNATGQLQRPGSNILRSKKEKDDSNYFTAGVIFQVVFQQEKFDLEFLLITQLFRGERQVKFPGGRANLGENPRQTLEREIRGETGISLEPDCILGEITEPKLNYYRKVYDRHFFLIDYRLTKGEILKQLRPPGHPEFDKEIVRAPYWVPFEKLISGEVELHESHMALFRNLMEKLRTLPTLRPFAEQIDELVTGRFNLISD